MLIACSAGQDNFAQALADRLGVEVTAADDIVTVNADGSLKVGRFRPGSWHTFAPMRQ